AATVAERPPSRSLPVAAPRADFRPIVEQTSRSLHAPVTMRAKEIRMLRVTLSAALALLVCGCGKGTDENSASDDQTSKPGEGEVSLKGRLGKSRQELATLEKEYAEKVRVEVTDLRTDRNAPLFLNSVRFPLTIPVWQEATYVGEVGFSLPPYLQPRVKDNA